MHGEKKENILSEKILAEVIADDIKINQKSLIDTSSVVKPEKRVNISVHDRFKCIKSYFNDFESA
jgi:hypothetical protein